MTRTERAAFPRALMKDRSLSRSGLNGHIRKDGAGQYNWGSISDEAELEFAALDDEQLELAADAGTNSSTNRYVNSKKARSPNAAVVPPSGDLSHAIEFRKSAFKGDEVDLVSIARTSAAVSHSPPKTTLSVAGHAVTTVSPTRA